MTENQKTQKRQNRFFSGKTKRGRAWLKAKARNKSKWFAAWYRRHPEDRIVQAYGRG